MLLIKEKNKIIKEFPDNVELKKNNQINYIQDYQDYYIFIPKGIKYFVWLKNDEPLSCYFLLLKNKAIIDCDLKYVSCDKTLFNNTILYGTLNNNDFIIEDIIYYKDKYVYHENFSCKCEKYFKNFLINESNNHKISFLKNNFINFYIVPFEVNYNNVENKLLEINIPLYEIIQIKGKNYKNYNIFNRAYIFKILPSLKNDIYNLYAYDNNLSKFIFFDTALVNDYKTSKFISKIFNLNNNIINDLDYIEMSDSEEEIDDFNLESQKQKIIDENKNYFVKCIYNKKFNKWKPIEHITYNYEKVINNNKCSNIKYLK